MGRAPTALGRLRAAAVLIAVVIGVVTLSTVGVQQRSRDSRTVPYADARTAAGPRPGPAVTAYPWVDEPDPSAMDPWGFRTRQCTSYVAWYLNTHGIPFATRTRGGSGVGRFEDASTWAVAATQAGFAVSDVPRAGSVAHWSAREDSLAEGGRDPAPSAGQHGHVAIVYRVLPDGSVDVAEFDGRTRQFQVRHDRAPRYLYIGLAPAVRPRAPCASTAAGPFVVQTGAVLPACA